MEGSPLGSAQRNLAAKVSPRPKASDSAPVVCLMRPYWSRKLVPIRRHPEVIGNRRQRLVRLTRQNAADHGAESQGERPRSAQGEQQSFSLRHPRIRNSVSSSRRDQSTFEKGPIGGKRRLPGKTANLGSIRAPAPAQGRSPHPSSWRRRDWGF